MLRRVWIVAIALLVAVVAAVSPGFLVASDHDDGETDTKGRNVNLTDVYAFREKDHDSDGSPRDLILIMNTNPRSVARQQYYFSTNARYEFRIERAANVNAAPTAAGLAVPDVVLRFTFGVPDAATRKQSITLTAIRDGVSTTVSAGTTTPLSGDVTINRVSVGGARFDIFAGLREDPFFFDVEQFFRVRAGALGLGPSVVFRPSCPATPCALDFTAGYNVNSIVVRVPISLLQGGTALTTFDVWTIICILSGTDCTQVERLAQPAINEGLLITNDLLNLLNTVGPADEAALLAGSGCAGALSNPIIGEAAATLLALGNTVPQALAICNAFLPDVMRIDVTGPSGYAAAVNTAGRPVRGRKIMDDVIDITLSVLVPGSVPALESDNVSFAGPNANGSGHKALLRKFPFLAAPN